MMSFLPVFLAAFSVGTESSTQGSLSKLLVTDVLIILGVGVALFAILFVWAKYLRKSRRRRKSHSRERAKVYSPPPSSSAGGPEAEAEVDAGNETEDEAEDEENASGRRRYKFRYRRRRHRSRNPTLSETGGLPPARPKPAQDTAPLE
jgi:hypothetical protein